MDEDWKNYQIPNADKYGAVKVVPYTAAGDPFQTLYVSRPVAGQGHPCVVWFHGGGMTMDGREYPPGLYDGCNVVVEPRYRISPAAPASAALEDAAAVVGWVWRHADEYGIDRRKIFVGGMSAGAYLAAMVTMNRDFARRYGFEDFQAAALLLVSGQMTTHFQVKADLGYPGGQYQPVIDELAPLAHLSAGLPPMLLVTGQSGLDIPARAEENALMAASLRALGHDRVWHYPLSGYDHGGVLAGSNYLVERFIRETLEEIR